MLSRGKKWLPVAARVVALRVASLAEDLAAPLTEDDGSTSHWCFLISSFHYYVRTSDYRVRDLERVVRACTSLNISHSNITSATVLEFLCCNTYIDLNRFLDILFVKLIIMNPQTILIIHYNKNDQQLMLFRIFRGLRSSSVIHVKTFITLYVSRTVMSAFSIKPL